MSDFKMIIAKGYQMCEPIVISLKGDSLSDLSIQSLVLELVEEFAAQELYHRDSYNKINKMPRGVFLAECSLKQYEDDIMIQIDHYEQLRVEK